MFVVMPYLQEVSKIIKRIGGKLVVIPVAKRVKDIVSNIEIIKSVK